MTNPFPSNRDKREFCARILRDCFARVLREEGIEASFELGRTPMGDLYIRDWNLSQEVLDRIHPKILNELAQVRVNGYHLTMPSKRTAVGLYYFTIH